MGFYGDVSRGSYLNKEESFMYDREKTFPMEDTCNEARIEFTETGGLVNLVSRRGVIVKLSRSGAVITMTTKFQLPRNFYLDIVSARIPMIGCLTQRVYPNDVVEARFLRLLSDKDLQRIFVYSTHRNHQNRTLDIYG
ncbi:hypothetical protein GR158_03485 [Shinella sp. AETb1-6]|jgi:hypothetical protein|uniref:Uncharacterized protein n=2 Tax=Shinella TaxID=323620 RepID=A0AA50D8E6_9HYPH|nr:MULTISPECIES: hypothetical protein [Shinella]MCD1265918.1 hypothetical protein [Shinella sumterensis]MXN50168.1 hypothetical protein [Shinella sp. AETb1-6]TFE97884.1 hypothetical protein B5M44_13120 [Shinella sumterensis]UPA24968.1 hypothetical protein K6301_01745 [Shinella oryzae]WLR96455.1 hypothetical protein Q9313_12100 [Shinella sumterensis]